MKKSGFVAKFASAYFDPKLELRVQAFNLLGFAGMFSGIIFAAVSLVQQSYFVAFICFTSFSLTFLMVRYVGKKISYRVSSWIIVISVFFTAFPLMFFLSGGYKSGMPCFFLFAVILTTIILEKHDRAVALSVEFILYTGCCLIAFFFPQAVHTFEHESAVMIDVVSALISCGILLAIVMLLHQRMYDTRQTELENANHALNDLNYLKTEFLQNISHDLKTPLTVISTDIINAADQLDYQMDIDDMKESLENAQREVMRMARLIDSAMKHSSIHKHRSEMQPLDLTPVIKEGAAAYVAVLERNGNQLVLDIPPSLPPVNGNADILLHVLSNLLSNANRYTRNGTIKITALASGNSIRVKIADNGQGVKPELLPHVFDRGVSDGGTGLGLHICRSAIETHFGEIKMESEFGKGTVVSFKLPLYKNQPGVIYTNG
ncbi:MAG: HAMP domain-containing histidine kinase [Defluviitaleaceae bacterium]|nr:HAMP domain-containing histidine kinase [Defluviitaleaceae bacterium]